MATHAVIPSLSLLLLLFTILPSLITAISHCGGPCRTYDDCSGQLICINRKCNDDPEVGTHTCSSSGGGGGGGSPSPRPPSGGGCKPSGTLACKGRKTKPTYTCSPPITSSTIANLSNNNFAEGEDGGGPSECDESYHKNTERIVALSTGWYTDGSRCGKMIKIRAKNGRTTTAKVVDECDSTRGCDEEHDYQDPCDNNIVDGSNAVWKALGLDIDEGRVEVTWSMA